MTADVKKAQLSFPAGVFSHNSDEHECSVNCMLTLLGLKGKVEINYRNMSHSFCETPDAA